jgi:hypothetical protein
MLWRRRPAFVRIAILRHIMRALEVAPDHMAPETQFLDKLRML